MGGMTIRPRDVRSATERLAAYRSHHRIEVDRSSEWNRCDTDSVRVHLTLNRRWYHDPSELRRLEQEAAREDLDRGVATFEAQRVADVIRIASKPLRQYERVVVDRGPGWELTADLEADPPKHNHWTPFDSDDSCLRCAYDVERAEG